MKHILIAVAACLVAAISIGCRRSLHQNRVTCGRSFWLAGDTHKDRVLRGVYPGTTGWRWTASVFALSLDPPAPGVRTYVEVDFTVPSELTANADAVSVVAKINGTEAARTTYRTAGRYVFAGKVAADLLNQRSAEVEFSVDRSF